MDNVRITRLKIRNFRALQSVEFIGLTSFTALLGPNSSGKSTVLDALAFLCECLAVDLGFAWKGRGGLRNIRSHGRNGNVEFDIEITFPDSKRPTTTYFVALNESDGKPIVRKETVKWALKENEQPQVVLQMSSGSGKVVQGVGTDAEKNTGIRLLSASALALTALAKFEEYAVFGEFVDVISNFYVASIPVEAAKLPVDRELRPNFNRIGENIPGAIDFLSRNEPKKLQRIFDAIKRRVPSFREFETQESPGGKIWLKLLDEPFSETTFAQFMSDGLLKTLAYILMLQAASPTPCICFEEPENNLHPRLVSYFVEECRSKSATSQVLLTTHSPHLLNDMRPDEVWLVWRGDDGFAKVQRVSEIKLISGFLDQGTPLGELWAEGHFGIGDPLNFKSAMDKGPFPSPLKKTG